MSKSQKKEGKSMKANWVIKNLAYSIKDCIEEFITRRFNASDFIEDESVYHSIPLAEISTVISKIKDLSQSNIHFGILTMKHRWVNKSRFYDSLKNSPDHYIVTVKAKCRNYTRDDMRRMEVTHNIYFINPKVSGLVCELVIKSYMQISKAGDDSHDEIMIDSCGCFCNGVLKSVSNLMEAPKLEVPISYKSVKLTENKTFDGYFKNKRDETIFTDSDFNIVIDYPVEISVQELEENDKILMYDALKNHAKRRKSNKQIVGV